MEKLPVILLFTGLIGLGLSFGLGWFILPNYVKTQIESNLNLENGTEAFKKWSNVSVPVLISIHLFNVTNHEDILDGKKPIVHELGPFVYEQRRVKVNITFDEERNSVSYYQPVTYHFREDLSHGSLDDPITILNIPLIGVGQMGERMSSYFQVLLNMYVQRFKQKPFVHQTVREVLFEGYEEPLMSALQNVTGRILLPDGTFGLYYGKNGTNDGKYEVNTGKDSSENFGKILSWNNVSELDWWGKNGIGGSHCNSINGSDGSLFPPFLEHESKLYIFSSDLCRSLQLTFHEDVQSKNIPAYKFILPKRLLEDPQTNPENRCFCTNPDPIESNCLKTGAIQLSACRKGRPIVASTPHFYGGDPTYVNDTVGLKPDPIKHETYLYIEPTSGLLLEGRKRIQINIETKPFKSIDVLERLPKMLFPVFWVEESYVLSDLSAKNLEQHLLEPIHQIRLWRWFFLTLSILFILLASTITCLRCRKKNHYTSKY